MILLCLFFLFKILLFIEISKKQMEINLLFVSFI